MRKLTLKLFSDFLSADGKYVDYKGIGTSKSFEVRETQLCARKKYLSKKKPR